MPKKTSGRKRGIRQCIPRHRIGRKKAVEEHEEETNEEEPNRLRFRPCKYYTLADKCLQIMLFGCQKLRLLGFTQTKNGEYVPLGRKDQICHYGVILCCLALWFQKTWGTVQVFLYEELGLQSFMCLSVATAYNAIFLCSVGVILRPKETMDLHNSWAHMSASVKNIDPHSDFRPLDNLSTCLKVISIFLVCLAVALMVGVVFVIVSDAPISLLAALEKFGFLPTSLLSKWAWQFIFALVEFLVVVPQMLLCSFCGCCLVIGMGAMELYLRQLGKIKVRSLESRRRLEQMYVQLELFNRIAQVWIRFYFPPWLVIMTAGVIIATFVTIRYMELPLIVYISFPYIAVILIALIFWTSYEMFCTVRASEDILGRLLQHHAPYFQGMSRANRLEEMKRAKAMRVLAFSIADSEFSLNLPISTWDEIINQLLFLLSF